MAGKRKTASPISLSFMDVMFCGFGAVVLLIVVLNTDVVRKKGQQVQDVRSALEHAILLEDLARKRIDELGKEIEGVELQQAALNKEAVEIETKVRAAADQTKAAEAKARAAQSSIAELRTQSAALESALGLLRAKAADNWRNDSRPIGFTGDGQRQYLTGLKLGGERTLILIDSSASMLDETVVNVMRRKLASPEARQGAPKWQRTVRTFHWLLANLRPGKQFQAYQFSMDATALVAGTEGRWLSNDDTKQLSAALAATRQIAPIGGTSLHPAFSVLSKLNPKPDSVIILTDGLPTQGGVREGYRAIGAEERLRFFSDAVRLIPPGIAVNTLLFPMEGDPFAAGAFWQLAVSTRGSFITPSRDWP